MRYDMLWERVIEVPQADPPTDGCNTGWHQSISTAETEVTSEWVDYRSLTSAGSMRAYQNGRVRYSEPRRRPDFRNSRVALGQEIKSRDAAI